MDEPRSASGVLLVAALAGAATMALELGAVRLIAPWFGTSVTVWTNVIGVILLALSIGYLAGARLARRGAHERSLAWVLLAAAAWTVWLPALVGPLCRVVMPSGIGLDQAFEVWKWGSLAATLVLFAPSAVLLGCVGPLAVETVQQRERGSAGSAGGRVLGVSTLGSLVGTFATTHVLVPRLGLSWTFLAAGATLAVLGAALFIAQRRRVGALLVLATISLTGSALRWSRIERAELPAGVTLLEECESAYQSLRVVEDRRWGAPVRLLQVNEGLDSFQSVWSEQPGLLGQGYYYDLFALPAWWSGAPKRWKVLVLGLGAGTAFRVLEGASPQHCELELWGVEIDPAVVAAGVRRFELKPDAPRVHVLSGVDGRAALAVLPRDFDLIVLDAYAHQVEIPFHLATEEAFAEMRAHLAPGGWLSINVGGFGFDDPVVAAVGATAASVFTEATVAYRVPRSRNFVIFARRDAQVPTPDGDAFWFAGDVATRQLPSLSLPTSVHRFDRNDGVVLSDDRSALDQLQQRSLEQGRARLASNR